MKGIVVYDSSYGNTKKIAATITETLKESGMEADLLSVKDYNFLVFCALTGLDGPRIAVNLPTPLVGVLERINIAGFLLWALVLAIVLFRAEKRQGSVDGSNS